MVLFLEHTLPAHAPGFDPRTSIPYYEGNKEDIENQYTPTLRRHTPLRKGNVIMNLLEDKNLTGYELAEWFNENLVGEYITRMYSHSIETRSGYRIIISEHEGCMACLNGWSDWTVNRTGENLGVVTSVKYKEAPDYEISDQFSIFIYLKSRPKIEVSGDDGIGNGCYGWGFHLNVESIEKMERGM